MLQPSRLLPRTTGVLAAVVTVAIWASFIIIARASSRHSLLPLDVTLCRIVGAAAVLLPWGWWLVRRRGSGWLGLSPLPARITVQIGLVGGLAYGCLVYTGFFFAPATHASVLMPGSLPLWTTLLAALILGTRITPARALGLALIVSGALLVGGRSLMSAFDGGDVWKGDLLFMSTAFCWSTLSVLLRRHQLDAVDATIATTVFAFLVFVPVYALLVLGGLVPSHLGQAPWRELLFQGVFQGVGSVAISGITFTIMVQNFGPVRSTMITALVPGLSALGAVLFLDEPLYWNLAAGLALVTIGITFGVRSTAPAVPVPAGAVATR